MGDPTGWDNSLGGRSGCSLVQSRSSDFVLLGRALYSYSVRRNLRTHPAFCRPSNPHPRLLTSHTLKSWPPIPIPTSSTSGSRRQSETWDAAKVPPSQFQLDKGSIFSTPNSKDGNVERGDRDKKYFDKLKEKVSLTILFT
ncbi:hypothetical protein IQ07DRAFT_266890 [Pyrenochaeta sp. DS3sAY3a]|nr:hypothetical protein IQ07DRAFT_266890 [Pyrenochaeta sp. DS3sAY3a]